MRYLLLIIVVVKLYSFEVNTHQAITKCAIENNNNKCNKQDTSNFSLAIKLMY